MTRETDIPNGPMQLGYTLGGFLPQVGIHRRGRAFYQESSYSHLWLSGLFVVPAIVIAFLPLGGYTKCVWSGFFLFAAACGVAPYFVRNRFGQTVIIDPEVRTVCIKKAAEEQTIPWSDIVALQLCRQERPSVAYQINLVSRGADSAFKRHCLAVHEVKQYAEGLARRYESLLSLRLSDETARSQPDAANRSRPVRPETDQAPSAANPRRWPLR